ncbi:MAG: dCTP deaminase, partial [Candidatus Binatia bacterium]
LESWSPPKDANPGTLSGSDLLARLSVSARPNQHLIATPVLPRGIREAGLDVRLSSSFIVFKHSATEVFDAISGDQDPREMQERVTKQWGERFILHPGELVLAATLEYLVLPSDLVGEVASRSSYGRLGLISVTASKIQPRSTGCITLELVNTSQTPIALTVGERIAQITFHRLANPVQMLVKPTYQWPTGPEFSLVRGDWDGPIIRGVQDILADRVPRIAPKRALELRNEEGALLLDVREEDEWHAGHVPGSHHHPLGALLQLGDVEKGFDLPKDRRIIVLSRGNNRSVKATKFLIRRGFQAFSLDGGLTSWNAFRLGIENALGEPGEVR